MMLADEDDDYHDNWGPCTGCKSTHNGSRTIMTHHHRASFILGTSCFILYTLYFIITLHLSFAVYDCQFDLCSLSLAQHMILRIRSLN